ncbi:MAG: hypothetical protein ACI4C1_06080 [Lachnospiraceae bacterium]
MVNMEKKDTIGLLKECDAGTKTAVNSIQEVTDHTQDQKLRQLLLKAITEHEALGEEAHELLSQYHAEEKDPGAMARSMSWMKINAKLMMKDSDKTIAELMTDGCDMGIKSLCGYKNQYSKANHRAVELTNKLIQAEEQLRENLKRWL